MYSKYIPRLLHYIELGDLEKITWCLEKDKIDINTEYTCKGQSEAFNLMSYVILREKEIPQCEDILLLFIECGGDLYQVGSGYGDKSQTTPWVAHLELRKKQRESDQRQKLAYSPSNKIQYDESQFIHQLFQNHPSSHFFNLQSAAQEAASRLDIEMLEMVLSIGADLTKPPSENANFPILENLRYAFNLEKKRDNYYISETDKELAERGSLLIERINLEQSLPDASRPKSALRL